MVRLRHRTPVSVKGSGHAVVHAGSVALALFTQVIAAVVLSLATDNYVPNALFDTSCRNVSEVFALDVTMDWWSENYWIMIDLWSVAWLLHAVLGLFKRNVLGPESCNPEIHPPEFYLMWIAINITRMTSMSLWHRGLIPGAVVLRWVLPVLSFYMLYISYSNLHKHKAWLSINNPSVIPWTRYLTQNGLAAFAWLSLLNALVGFGIVLKYEAGVLDPLVSTIVLTVISLCTTTWFILQSFLLTKYLRYTYSVYAILVLGLGAMLTRSYRVHDLAANTVFCGVLMIIMTIMNFIHLISACLCKDKSTNPPPIEPYVMFMDRDKVWQPEGNHNPQKC